PSPNPTPAQAAMPPAHTPTPHAPSAPTAPAPTVQTLPPASQSSLRTPFLNRRSHYDIPSLKSITRCLPAFPTEQPSKPLDVSSPAPRTAPVLAGFSRLCRLSAGL